VVPQTTIDEIRQQIRELAEEIARLEREEAEAAQTPEQRRTAFRLICR
jgi:hypothetical protein